MIKPSLFIEYIFGITPRIYKVLERM